MGQSRKVDHASAVGERVSDTTGLAASSRAFDDHEPELVEGLVDTVGERRPGREGVVEGRNWRTDARAEYRLGSPVFNSPGPGGAEQRHGTGGDGRIKKETAHAGRVARRSGASRGFKEVASCWRRAYPGIKKGPIG